MKRRYKRKRQNIAKHKDTSNSKPFFADLPQDIIQDILCLLPVKTLIGLRCVSKSWLYLISNPQFIKTHLQTSNSHNSQRLILFHCSTTVYTRKSIYSLKLLSIDVVDDGDSSVIDFRKHPCCPLSLIAASCNGLVCFMINKVEVFLRNPSTKISKKLPLLSGTECQHCDPCGFGFGHDRLNDDYKVVFIMFLKDGTRKGRLSRFDEKVTKVYSLKSNLWRDIGCFPHHSLILRPRAIYINGILHWDILIGDVIKNSRVIVSFDPENDSYGEIVGPCFGDESNVSCLSLCVLNGCLSMFCGSKKTDLKEIWVMKEYGIIDTWRKLYTIPDFMGNYYFPLCITMTGEIMLMGNHGLVLYNPTNGAFRDPNTGRMSSYFLFTTADTYVESLVSPNIDEVPSPKSLLQGHASDELVNPRRSSRLAQANRKYMT